MIKAGRDYCARFLYAYISIGRKTVRKAKKDVNALQCQKKALTLHTLNLIY